MRLMEALWKRRLLGYEADIREPVHGAANIGSRFRRRARALDLERSSPGDGNRSITSVRPTDFLPSRSARLTCCPPGIRPKGSEPALVHRPVEQQLGRPRTTPPPDVHLGSAARRLGRSALRPEGAPGRLHRDKSPQTSKRPGVLLRKYERLRHSGRVVLDSQRQKRAAACSPLLIAGNVRRTVMPGHAVDCWGAGAACGVTIGGPLLFLPA